MRRQFSIFDEISMNQFTNNKKIYDLEERTAKFAGKAPRCHSRAGGNPGGSSRNIIY